MKLETAACPTCERLKEMIAQRDRQIAALNKEMREMAEQAATTDDDEYS